MRPLAVLLLLVSLLPGSAALASAESDEASNVQHGNNVRTGAQGGESRSGDAVVGQKVGAGSSGDASVDATNHTEDSSAASGDATGSNTSTSVVGLVGASDTNVTTDVANGEATNVQEGDNVVEVVQRAFTSSGDAIGGQVHGVTTAPGGTADLVFANTSIDVDTETGDTDFVNDASTFVGHEGAGGGVNGLFVSVSDAQRVEGGVLVFRVFLSGPGVKGRAAAAADPVTATLKTTDGSARADVHDYEPTSAIVTVRDGGATVSVPAPQDGTTCENEETVLLEIVSATGAEVRDGSGIGTIIEATC